MISCILFSCKKNVVEAVPQNNPDFATVMTYLGKRQDTSSARDAQRIEVIKNNLVDQEPQKIKVANYEIWFFDLVKYRNQPLPEYSNSYYKAYFTLEDGKIVDGLVLTLHSNDGEKVIDENLINVFLGQAHRFSGMVVTNLLNNRFMKADSYQSGRLTKQYHLNDRNDQNETNSPEIANTNDDDCVYYYLVTTTIYSDGHVEREVTYLYRLCGDCVPEGQPVAYLVPDCGDGSGGGGGGSNPDNMNTFVETRTEGGDDYAPGAPQVKYLHRATIMVIDDVISNVQMLPTFIENPSAKYMDGNGKFVGRLLTTLSHYNTYSLVTSRSALLNWYCQVHGRYTYTDGTPTYTRQWVHSHSEVRS